MEIVRGCDELSHRAIERSGSAVSQPRRSVICCCVRGIEALDDEHAVAGSDGNEVLSTWTFR